MKTARCNLFFGIIFGMSTALMTTESQGQTLIGDFGDFLFLFLVFLVDSSLFISLNSSAKRIPAVRDSFP